MKIRQTGRLVLAFVLCAFCFAGCREPGKAGEVVVYTAVDQVYSEPVFQAFEEETGIKVKAVYDLESNKTTGLTNRLIAEKDKPVCDVFWNNEFVQTMALQNEGLLQPYFSPAAQDIPDAYRDPDGMWTAFGGRARVLLVNTDLLSPEEYPSSIYDLTGDRYPAEMIAIAYPMFGTTRTQAAAVYAAVGPEEGRRIFETLAQRGVQVVDGNSVTRDMAAAGQVAMGYTDTDDAKGAIADGKPVEMVFLDQGEGEMGSLITPNTAAMIAGAPNEENAKRFLDYIVSAQLEKRLIEEGFFDLSVREGATDGLNAKGMAVNLRQIYEQLETASADMQELFATSK
ncbi:MAG: extracellular solute-binding protein [Oscillospiraceae bacterium]|nr:extracellular solute-binding protein [Oscillospiraceae bacterium]